MAKNDRIIVVVPKKKGKPRGNHNHPAFEQQKQRKGDPALPGAGSPYGPKVGAKFISQAYKSLLTDVCPDDIIAELDLPAGSTFSDAIAWAEMRQALRLGGEGKQHVDQEAVHELREVTEGKLPDKTEFSGRDGTPLSPPPPVTINFVDPPKEDVNNEAKE
jgi:hypothetical protein